MIEPIEIPVKNIQGRPKECDESIFSEVPIPLKRKRLVNWVSKRTDVSTRDMVCVLETLRTKKADDNVNYSLQTNRFIFSLGKHLPQMTEMDHVLDTSMKVSE